MSRAWAVRCVVKPQNPLCPSNRLFARSFQLGRWVAILVEAQYNGLAADKLFSSTQYRLSLANTYCRSHSSCLPPVPSIRTEEFRMFRRAEIRGMYSLGRDARGRELIAT